MSHKMTSWFLFLLAFWAGSEDNSASPSLNDPLHEVADWPVLPPGIGLGQVTGLAVDSHNHVFVFHRAGRTWTEPFPNETIPDATIFMFDGDSGVLLARWGAGRFVMPHGLSIDDEDNVWVTDVGLEQIFAFSHDGQFLHSIGAARESGNDDAHFGRPADIAFDQASMFVADGYTNTRVAVFSREGEFTNSLGGVRGTAPGQFDLPHGIAHDSGRLYVADRSNSRLQLWSTRGEVEAIWPREMVGTPYGVDVSDNGIVAVIDGGDQPNRTAAIVRLFDRAGTSLGSHDTRRSGDSRNLGHDIAFGRNGALYVADTWAMRVVKLLPNSPPSDR